MAKYPRSNRKLFQIEKCGSPSYPYVVYVYINEERERYYCYCFKTKKEARTKIIKYRQNLKNGVMIVDEAIPF